MVALVAGSDRLGGGGEVLKPIIFASMLCQLAVRLPPLRLQFVVLALP
jgi:hypothetical protein